MKTYKVNWSEEWPEREGVYWFYGYRYGKMFGSKENEKELMLIKCIRVINGTAYTGDGQFVFKSEVEEPLFCEALLPEIP